MLNTSVIERETELAQLNQVMRRSAGGRGSLVAVAGPPGIGRSSLLATAARSARNTGWRVLDAHCEASSATVGHGVLRDWISHVDTSWASLVGPGRPLADLVRGESRTTADVANAFRWLIEQLTTDVPLMLVVDDAQWADSASLQVLEQLLGTLRSLPCLILLGVRTPGPLDDSTAIGRLLASSRRLEPAPLTRSGVAARVHESCPNATDEEIDRVHAATGGVPLFIETMLHAGPDGPESVTASVHSRLTRLPQSATDTVRAACALGSQARIGTVAEVTGHAIDAVSADVALLTSANLIVMAGGRLTAQNPLVSEAVLGSLSPEDSDALHRKAARVLTQRGAPAGLVAHHLIQTLPTDDSEVRDLLAGEGHRALVNGDTGLANRLLDRALAEGELTAQETALVAASAVARISTDDLTGALERWELAAGLTDDPLTAADIRGRAADALADAGRVTESRDAYVRLLDSTTAGPVWRDVAARLVISEWVHGFEVVDSSPWTPEMLQGPEDPAFGQLSAAILLTRQVRDAVTARDLAIRCTELQLADPSTNPGRSMVSAGLLAWTSSFAEGDRLFSEGMDAARRSGSATEYSVATACRGYVRARMGLVSEAILDLEDTLAHSALGWRAASVSVLAGLLDCHLAKGDLAEAGRYATELEWFINYPGLLGAMAYHALGSMNAAMGDHEAAVDCFLKAGALVNEVGDNPAVLAWRSDAAISMINLGRRQEATALARENLDLAQRFGSPYAIAQALRTVAATDVTAERNLMLRQALSALSGTQAPRLVAQLETDLAGLLQLTDPSDQGVAEAHALLRSAERYAVAEELWPLHGRITRQFKRLGHRARRVPNDGMSKLTVAERRVVRLALDGMSDREIADHLFLTTRTIEWQMASVCRKLGIRSRARLAEVIGNRR